MSDLNIPEAYDRRQKTTSQKPKRCAFFVHIPASLYRRKKALGRRVKWPKWLAETLTQFLDEIGAPKDD